MTLILVEKMNGLVGRVVVLTASCLLFRATRVGLTLVLLTASVWAISLGLLLSIRGLGLVCSRRRLD